MEIYVYIVFFVVCIVHVFCNTGSDQLSWNAAELKDIEDKLKLMKNDINFQSKSRINLDQELSDLTRRYRELLLENSDIQEAMEETKHDVVQNMTSATLNVKHELGNVLKTLSASENKTSVLLSKIRADTTRELEETKNVMVGNMTSVAANVQRELDNVVKAQSDAGIKTSSFLSKIQTDIEETLEDSKNDMVNNMTSLSTDIRNEIHNVLKAQSASDVKLNVFLNKMQTVVNQELAKTRNDIVNNMTSVRTELDGEIGDVAKRLSESDIKTDSSLSKLQNEVTSLNQTLAAAVSSGALQQGQHTKELDKLKHDTDGSLTQINDVMRILNGTLIKIEAKLEKLRDDVDTFPRPKGKSSVIDTYRNQEQYIIFRIHSMQ